MNILVDRAPIYIEIDGINYNINSDFRTFIIFEMLMQDEEVEDNIKILQAMKLFYQVIPDNIDKAVDKLLWFYRGGRYQERISNEIVEESIIMYSYDYDAEYIYSAFLEQYGIDLQDIEYLHWWKFKAMFKSISENTQIYKIMRYRTIIIDSKMSKEEKEFYIRMKRIYEIPLANSKRDKINKIEEALLKNGDLSGLV